MGREDELLNPKLMVKNKVVDVMCRQLASAEDGTVAVLAVLD